MAKLILLAHSYTARGMTLRVRIQGSAQTIRRRRGACDVRTAWRAVGGTRWRWTDDIPMQDWQHAQLNELAQRVEQEKFALDEKYGRTTKGVWKP